jgi:NAD(P)-dependent dehydrogenase (short-subunit alcohol dehydrogenase family)
MSSLEGKVAIVTGAGRGIGREEALMLASEGARVVVNDLGGHSSSDGGSPAHEVCSEIEALGGEAAVNLDDVTDPDGARRLIATAVDGFGRLDILVNNAGILKDGMVFSADPDEWRRVVEMHAMAHFLPTRFATEHWRNLAKSGETSHRAVVNTTSESGLFGNAGQSNYDLAKLGIVSFTMAVAKETRKYGVTVNAIAPRARTRLTTGTFEGTDRAGEFAAADDDVFDAMHPGNIAPFVAFLAGPHAEDITGQVFIVYGAAVAHVQLPQVSDLLVNDGRWTIDQLAARRDELFKNVGPDVFEGPRGYARLPKQ